MQSLTGLHRKFFIIFASKKRHRMIQRERSVQCRRSQCATRSPYKHLCVQMKFRYRHYNNRGMFYQETAFVTPLIAYSF